MARLGYYLIGLLGRVATTVARAMPPMVADMVGAWLGRSAHRLLISRREVAMENMRRALGGEMSEVLMRRTVYKVFESVGRTVVEVARFGKTRPAM